MFGSHRVMCGIPGMPTGIRWAPVRRGSSGRGADRSDRQWMADSISPPTTPLSWSDYDLHHGACSVLRTSKAGVSGVSHLQHLVAADGDLSFFSY